MLCEGVSPGHDLGLLMVPLNNIYIYISPDHCQCHVVLYVYARCADLYTNICAYKYTRACIYIYT